MKNLSILPKALFVSITLLFTSCDDMTVQTGDGSDKVKGNGVFTTEERAISSFNQISLEGVFNVYLIQKSKESIRIEADENILPYIITEVENNILTVKMKDDSKIIKVKKINVYVTLADINKLETKGVGLLNCMGKLNLRNVELNLNGVGATKLNLDCDVLDIHSELVGALQLSGTANELKIKHKGIGAFEAFNFKAKKLSLESDGVGKAEVYASEELIVDAKGIGGVIYKGNPGTKNIKSNGVGVVESAN